MAANDSSLSRCFSKASAFRDTSQFFMTNLSLALVNLNSITIQKRKCAENTTLENQGLSKTQNMEILYLDQNNAVEYRK